MPDFMSMRMSSPVAFNAQAGAALATAAADLMTALRQYQKTSDLSSAWMGSASQSHTDRVAKLADAATRVIQAITQTQTLTATNGAQLTALKVQNDAITASAMAGQYCVLPSGQVVPGPPHYAASSGPHGAALMKLFWTIANLYSGQINGTVAASTMTDAQAAATIAAVAVQFFSDLLGEKDKAPAPGSVNLDPNLPGSGLPTTVTGPVTTLPALDPLPGGTGTQLEGIGDLGGIGPLGPGGIGGIGGLGPAGLGGVGALGGAGGAFGPGGGLGPGGLLAGGAGMVGTAGAAGTMGAGGAGGAGGSAAAGAAARAGAGGGMMPMMPMGAHGGGSGEQGHSAESWLHEDGDPFDPGDAAPGSVLS
jgi:uncharacterized protein YukE